MILIGPSHLKKQPMKQPTPDLLQNLQNMIGWMSLTGWKGTITLVEPDGPATITITGCKSTEDYNALAHGVLLFIKQCAEDAKDVKLTLASKDAYDSWNKHYPALQTPTPMPGLKAAGLIMP